MATSSLLRHGPGHAATLLDGLRAWMSRKGFGALGELRGKLAAPTGSDQTARRRADYVTALKTADATHTGPGETPGG